MLINLKSWSKNANRFEQSIFTTDKSDDDDRDELTINEEVSRDMTAESDGMNLGV